MGVRPHLSNDELSRFVDADLETFRLSGLNVDLERARRWLERRIVDELGLNDSQTKRQRHRLFAISGTQPDDFTEHVVDLDERRKVWCGIRHEGLDPKRPFVHLRPSFLFESRDDVVDTYRAVAPRFRMFGPKALRFFHRHEQWGDVAGAACMVCTASEMVASMPRTKEARINLVPVRDEACFDWYEAGYARFHAEHPELRHCVTVSSRKTMRSSLEQRLLYTCEMQGERMGLIAATREPLLGAPGIYFIEIYISDEWRRQGWGKALQSKFVRTVCTGEEIVWGTIDGRNTASLKTAESNGRRPIRHELFISTDTR